MLDLSRLRRALSADADVPDERLIEMAAELITSRGLKLSRSPDPQYAGNTDYHAGYAEGQRFQREQLSARGLGSVA
jgi:hypothetical protein